MPIGELPAARSRTGEVTVALLVGVQILAARDAEPRPAQFLEPLVTRPTMTSPGAGKYVGITRSCRESRFRSRKSTSNADSPPIICSAPKVLFPLPGRKL